jgi:hypothetical protein
MRRRSESSSLALPEGACHTNSSRLGFASSKRENALLPAFCHHRSVAFHRAFGYDNVVKVACIKRDMYISSAKIVRIICGKSCIESEVRRAS